MDFFKFLVYLLALPLVFIVILVVDLLCINFLGFRLREFLPLLRKGKIRATYKRQKLKPGDVIYVQDENYYLPVIVGTNWTYIRKISSSQDSIVKLMHYNIMSNAYMSLFRRLISLNYDDFLLKEELPNAYRVLYVKE